MDFAAVYRRLVQQLPARFEVATGAAAVSGILVEVDTASGKSTAIARLRYEETDAPLEGKEQEELQPQAQKS
jgi:calcineurin-like phosphoesterase